MPLNTSEANARCLEETWNLAKGSCSTFDVDGEQPMVMWKEESGDAWEGASIGGLAYSWLLRSLTLRAVPDARDVESTAWFSRKYCEKIGKSNVLKLIEHYPFHDEGHILHGWSSENDDSRQGRCPPRGLAYVSALTHKVCFLLRSSRVSLQCCELHFRDPLSSLLKCFCSCPKAYSVFEVSIVGRISTWSVLFLHALITWIFPKDARGACAGSFRIWRCRTVYTAPHALPVRRSRNVSFRSTAWDEHNAKRPGYLRALPWATRTTRRKREDQAKGFRQYDEGSSIDIEEVEGVTRLSSNSAIVVINETIT